MQGSESVLCRLGACFRRSVCETGGLETILRGSWRPCTLFLHEYKLFLGCLLKISLHYIVRGEKNRDAIKYKKREYYITKTFQDFVGYSGISRQCNNIPSYTITFQLGFCIFFNFVVNIRNI